MKNRNNNISKKELQWAVDLFKSIPEDYKYNSKSLEKAKEVFCEQQKESFEEKILDAYQILNECVTDYEEFEKKREWAINLFIDIN